MSFLACNRLLSCTFALKKELSKFVRLAMMGSIFFLRNGCSDLELIECAFA